jgi:hypothetical protein
MPKASPFYLLHKPDEFETLARDYAQPPEPDMGFHPYDNERLMWPIEAKVLRTDGAVGEYVNEVTGNFLTCRYAPFSGEGGMLGYLVVGSPNTAFDNIAKGLQCNLLPHPDFQKRNHRTSRHTRTAPRGKKYPRSFVCHHMILAVGRVLAGSAK